VALINRRRFNQDDFRKFHPGGSLGERLSVRVKEVMLTGDRVPMVPLGSTARRAIEEIDKKKIGATLVTEADLTLAGIISDGDLRRALLRREHIHRMGVEDIMSASPKTIDQNKTAAEALALMETYGITHLAIVDANHRVEGIVHLHDLLGRKDFRLDDGLNSTARTHR